ncbi:hypothetical protein DH2020_005917 [Rehmannia glutinosa]|uniref:SH3 domain-containing protein n=1 Tax=Rehmannia glutinosa TaxID=99300 RepID=A0ABR0XHW1_REHGL
MFVLHWQAILRQLGQLGHGGVMIDEGDIELHQQLQNLYKSTRAAKVNSWQQVLFTRDPIEWFSESNELFYITSAVTFKELFVAQHFQRDIVRGLDGFISTSKKQMEIARKLAEDCCKYGIENQDSRLPCKGCLGFWYLSCANGRSSKQCLGILVIGKVVGEVFSGKVLGGGGEGAAVATSSPFPPASVSGCNLPQINAPNKHHKVCYFLARSPLDGTSCQICSLHGTVGYLVSEPLRAIIKGAPLEDARHLTHRYDRMRQEFEIQAAEVIRRQSKSRDTSAESALKLKSAEKKLTELKSSMLALGREATAAMSSVEDQQQETTFQKLLTMVDAERSYHQNVIAILEKLHSEMILEEQMEDSSLPPEIPPRDYNIPSPNNDIVSDRSNGQDDENKSESYFIAKVIHSFDAQADGELGLELDDYVVVRQVASNGWSEGECNGKAGWFPSAYVERETKFQQPNYLEMILHHNF